MPKRRGETPLAFGGWLCAGAFADCREHYALSARRPRISPALRLRVRQHGPVTGICDLVHTLTLPQQG